jgi:hypothetical protein
MTPTATTVLAHLRATTAADQAKWLAEALRRNR